MFKNIIKSIQNKRARKIEEKYSNLMNEVVSCDCCGKKIRCGDGYNWFEAGLVICEECYKKEGIV